MAKKQHGEMSSISKTADSEKMTDKFDPALDSSDDDAPEEVTFEDSKASALRSMRDALDTARREKELLKDKRRKRQELFQEQKKRRLLPADILEEIDTPSLKTQNLSEDQGKDVAFPTDKSIAEEETGASEEEDDIKDKEDERPKKNKWKTGNVRNLKGNYKVMSVKEPPSASSQQQAALDFLQTRLYGPGSGRTTSNELLSLENKRGRTKSAAVQFVKKDWASKEKEKAEKLKQRWIHKQKMTSS